MQHTAFKCALSLDDKRLLSIDEYCWTYQQGRTTAYAAIKSGELRSLKRGRRRLIPREWAEDYHRNLMPEGVVDAPAADAGSAADVECPLVAPTPGTAPHLDRPREALARTTLPVPNGGL